MKKVLVILLILPFASFAEEVADTVKYWKRSGVFGANFSQVSLTNWAAGGQSSMSGVFLMNYNWRIIKKTVFPGIITLIWDTVS
jgi:hypothetical protein